MYDEFDEIRPYHDEELPEVYEELIADPAFRQVASAAFPSVPFEMLAAKMLTKRNRTLTFPIIEILFSIRAFCLLCW